jgi:hypothetical protein
MKVKFFTEIFVANEEHPLGHGVGITEDASIAEAILHLKSHNYTTRQIASIETYQIPQHYSATELA